MKVAIIGSGGAGITAAWLLDGCHEVTLFERNQVLGGHAHTTVVERDGRTHYADDGFAWFSDTMYPKLMRLLELTGVPLRTVPLSLSFTHRHQGRTLVLPPEGGSGLLRQLTSPSDAIDLLRLEYAIRLAEPMVRKGDKSVTWGEFARRFPTTFVRDVLTPMMAGVWCGSHELASDFSAYTLMKYYVLHRPSLLSCYRWRVIRDGAASYIRTIADTLKTCTILRSTAITGFVPRQQGWILQDSHGRLHEFDYVIMATGARDAHAILKDTPMLEGVSAILNRVKYYTTRVATHSDPSYMPTNHAQWKTANISTNGIRAALTVWTDAHRGSHVFPSYIDDQEPKECYNISTFHLPFFSPEHYCLQDKLAEVQGQKHLWFAGDWTRDIGCHEDAIESAFQACQRIDPTLPRLAELASRCQIPPVETRTGILGLFGAPQRSRGK